MLHHIILILKAVWDLQVNRSNLYQANLCTGCLFLPSLLDKDMHSHSRRQDHNCFPSHRYSHKALQNDINSMVKCNHTWDFLYPDNELSLCSRKKTVCLQVLRKTFREPLIKVLRELWMAAYSREDFGLASSERLISLGVGRHSLMLCTPHFSYTSKCCAFKKCKMIVLKSGIGLKPHATIPQLCVLPSTSLHVISNCELWRTWQWASLASLSLFGVGTALSCFTWSPLAPWGFSCAHNIQ